MTDVLFKGAMPAFYDRYLGPIAVAPYAAEMAARVKALAPRRVLETACGTGIVTYAMRDALPANVEIVATAKYDDGFVEEDRGCRAFYACI